MEKIIPKLIQDLNKRYQPHTIILYGSRARGKVSRGSDIDIVCFSDNSDNCKDAREFMDSFLDAWIYDTDSMDANDPQFIRLFDGYCLQDTQELGEPFLKKIRTREQKGPKTLSDSERQHSRVWIQKMLHRCEQPDIEADCNKALLATALLEHYFTLSDRWYFGVQKSLAWLSDNDPVTYLLFERLFTNRMDIANLQPIAHIVLSLNKQKQ